MFEYTLMFCKVCLDVHVHLPIKQRDNLKLFLRFGSFFVATLIYRHSVFLISLNSSNLNNTSS